MTIISKDLCQNKEDNFCTVVLKQIEGQARRARLCSNQVVLALSLVWKKTKTMGVKRLSLVNLKALIIRRKSH